MLELALAGLGLGLAGVGFYLGRGYDKSQLRRKVFNAEAELADLRAAFERLFESHKRLRSSERMAELRLGKQVGAAPRAGTSELSSDTAQLSPKDQLRLKAGLIPRPVASTRAPSDA